MKIPQSLIANVAFLFVEESGNRQELGTAFFVYIDEADHTFAYLVTCKHVIDKQVAAGLPIDIRLNRSDSQAVGYSRLPDAWQYHPDPAVDLAILPWQSTHEPHELIAMKWESLWVTDELLASRNHQLSPGDEAFMIGLFVSFSGSKRNIPLVRFGKFSAVPSEPLRGFYGDAEHYLLEIQAYPGFSGSPLYVVLPPSPPKIDRKNKAIQLTPSAIKLAGLITSYWPDKQMVYKYGGHDEVNVWTHFGISAAIPAKRIEELLNGAVVKAIRKKEIDERKQTDAPEPAGILATSSIDDGEDKTPITQ